MTMTPERLTQLTQLSTEHAWHHMPLTEVNSLLETNVDHGLSFTVVAQRQASFGSNELQVKPGQPAWLRFLLQFHQALLYILLIAGTIKAYLGSWTNAAVIWGVTLINAVIGFVQESKAEGAIAALAKAVTTEATVIRDGQRILLPSQSLVPGDVVLLTSGDKVPADLRLVHSRTLQIDESALTGESIAVEKSPELLSVDTPLAERTNMAFAGSFVTFGQAKGLVVATGNFTQVGQISKSMHQHANLSTPLTRKFATFSQVLLYIILGFAAFTFVAGVGQGKPWTEMFEAAVALAVSAIPEGLPAVVTVTLAIGVNRMARRHAIIRKLPAVETLGSTTVICSDKTGTLTENQMTVQALWSGGILYDITGVGYSPMGDICVGQASVSVNELPALQACLIAGMLCNDSQLLINEGYWIVIGDPTEGALLAAGMKAGLNQSALTKLMPRLDSIPFESQFQYMATLHQAPDTLGIYAKGSVEAILSRCEYYLDAVGCKMPINTEPIYLQVEDMAQRGLRVLALATKVMPKGQRHLDHSDLESGLTFLGLQGMIDPPRPEAIAAVQACQSAGIQVKMITGDHITTAQAIAEQMGIKTATDAAFTGQQLAQMDNIELKQAVTEGTVFARVAPTQKLLLVEALQAKGEIVAMTGDGVNDAPALKQADIGIAMGRAGTDVAKEAADMLLTDDNFASIQAAVEEGRTVYQNLRKAIAFILPVNGGESMTILISALLARDLPILSLQVLWLNMVNSVTMTVPLAFEPKSSGVMHQPPRHPQEPLLSAPLLKRILAVSVFNWILIFGLFEWVKQMIGDITLARTIAIQSLVSGRIIYLLSISHLGAEIAARLRGKVAKMGDSYAIGIGIFCTIILQILFSQWSVMNTLFSTAPLSANQWLMCLIPILPMMGLVMLVNRMDTRV